MRTIPCTVFRAAAGHTWQRKSINSEVKASAPSVLCSLLKFRNLAKGSHCEQCSAMVTSLEPETKGILGDWREDSFEVTRRVCFRVFLCPSWSTNRKNIVSSVEEL